MKRPVALVNGMERAQLPYQRSVAKLRARWKQHVVDILTYALFIVLAFLIVFPLLWMVYSSFKEGWDIAKNPYALPTKPTVANYQQAWTKGNFGLYFLNSIIMTGPGVLGLLLISSLGGYAFARLNFWGKRALFGYLMIGIMIPGYTVLIPTFQVMAFMHLINTRFALYFTYWSWCSVAILILRAFFHGIPWELIQAAKIDGCSTFGTFWKIALPLAKPGIATVAIFYFVIYWNDFIWPLILLREDAKNTIPLGLMIFRGQFTVNWGGQLAALTIALLPPIVFYMFFQGKFVNAITAGALKG
jgi:ABC-type glycerol-3-phosphate transport system permease component